MITQNYDGIVVTTNIGRPSYRSEAEFLIWDDIFEFIETSNLPIATNGMYDHVRELCRNRKGYLGGGFRFEFAFSSVDDCAAFENEINKICTKHGIREVSDFYRRDVAAT